MGRVFIYRNGYLEVVGKDFEYEMRYYRNEKRNMLVKNYKCDYHVALTKFKKVIDTEGF